MGAADGPAWCPETPGYRPESTPPCPCRECVAGPGLNIHRLRNHMAHRKAAVQAAELSSRETVAQLLAKAGLPPRPHGR